MSSPVDTWPPPEAARASAGLTRIDYWPWLLGAGVLISRILTRGTVYFADGPAYIRAITSRTFVIQPPGYWLFNRTASLFPNPAFGISLMNWVFSLTGVVIFYYAARLVVGDRMAKMGSALYAAIFYAWFSGDVHSTYASQLLAPVLVFELLILHARERKLRFLIGASIVFAIGAGLRPSDGAFIGFMLVYYLLRYAPRKQAFISFALAVAGCLGWLVPTLICYRSLGGLGQAGRYVGSITTQVSVLTTGLNRNSIANMARFAVPLIFALGPLLPFALISYREIRRPEVRLIWIWAAPGALFLLLCYMSDAPYLNFLTAAVVLLALIGLQESSRRRQLILLMSCLIWNLAFFLFFRPVRTKSLPFAVVDAYAGRYTRYAIANHWEPKLSELLRQAHGAPGATPTRRGIPAAELRPIEIISGAADPGLRTDYASAILTRKETNMLGVQQRKVPGAGMVASRGVLDARKGHRWSNP
jgi:hypothetical protein